MEKKFECGGFFDKTIRAHSGCEFSPENI